MRQIDYEELMKMCSGYMLDSEYRAFLDHVNKKWYVEASSTEQGGTVVKVIRNRYGIPVCLQVICGDDKKDYISADRISFYEPWDDYVSSFDEYTGGDAYY